MPGRPKTRARKLTALELSALELFTAIENRISEKWMTAWQDGRFASAEDEMERELYRAYRGGLEASRALGHLAAATRHKSGLVPRGLPLYWLNPEQQADTLRAVGIDVPARATRALQLANDDDSDGSAVANG